MSDLYQAIREAVADGSGIAAIRIVEELCPAGGHGHPVAPPTFPGQGRDDPPRIDLHRRHLPDGSGIVPVVTLDGIASQANRSEDALAAIASEVGLPTILLDLSGIEGRPGHLPEKIASWQFPHRHADTYLREAEDDGKPVLETEWGRALAQSSFEKCGPLLNWFPQSLVFGWWNSNVADQTRAARSYTSEIVGWNPPEDDIRYKLGVKGDPLHLSSPLKVKKQDDGSGGFKVDPKGKAISSVGLGQVPLSTTGGKAAVASMSFDSITRTAVISLASARRVSAGTDDSNADVASRVLIASLAIAGHCLAESTFLRSGCDLYTVERVIEAVGSGEPRRITAAVARQELISLLRSAFDEATAAGIDLSAWGSTKTLLPGNKLEQIIQSSYEKAKAGAEDES